MKHYLKKLVGYLMLFGMLYIGYSVLNWTINEFHSSQNSKTWSSVSGIIVSSSVERSSSKGSFHPCIKYRYSVGDKVYEGYRVGFGSEVGKREWAESIIARYPVTKIVTVFFDATQPSESSLETTLAHWEMYASASFGILLVIFPIILFFVWRRTGEI